MSKLLGIFSWIHSRFDYRQPVYIPGYEYSPWKKWLKISSVAILTLILLASFMRSDKSTGAKKTNIISSNNNSAKQVSQLSGPYEVVNVIDGDTIDLNIDGKTERLRLIGVDTPETLDPRKIVQCFGAEASDKAKDLLTGKSVYIESDSTQSNRDKYNRLLRYVYFQDKTSFNKLMISEGYAHEYTYYIPYVHQIEYKQAQKDAESKEKGLWSPAKCNGITTQSASPSTTTAVATSTPKSANCNPNYTPCVENSPSDLNCSDIGFTVQVIGNDQYRLDRNGNHIGCESY